MNASVNRKRAPAPPLGVVASLTAGFEAVNARLVLILLPLVLDLFLWLGPRLSILPLVEQMVNLLQPPAAAGPDAAGMQQVFEAMRTSLLNLGVGFNLFAVLSTAPLGLPSLMAGRPTLATPLGAPAVWPIENGLGSFFFFGVFSLAGLLLGALYFGGIAQQVRDARLAWGLLARQVWGDWARLTTLAVLALGLVFILGGPTLVMAVLLALIHPLLGNLASIIGATLILWALIFGAFALPGIVLQRRGLLGALWDSVRLVQSNLPQTAGLFVAVVLVNFGLSGVWNLPGGDSWFLLLGLGGHALVSTALVAAIFVFYQDRYRWWLETQQALRARPEGGAGRGSKD
ncbi:MAG: hypothetical protein JNK29_08810 [Anaerolineales bacterium]|nr:hypothetical protein [Anaerolineales bacterium]